MEPTGAAENLQVIRTLMERSALYRRAMAPVMLAAGLFGMAGWGVGTTVEFIHDRTFVAFWFGVAASTVASALLIVRRQAFRSEEPFWTPPTRRIVRAMIPPLVAGTLVTLPFALGEQTREPLSFNVAFWVLFYGCALHSAGMFISRGVRLLGWMFILAGCGLGAAEHCGFRFGLAPHAQMGLTFGLFHLVAAAYLFLTERRGQANQSSVV